MGSEDGLLLDGVAVGVALPTAVGFDDGDVVGDADGLADPSIVGGHVGHNVGWGDGGGVI